jgi:PTH1 family peptidyl-tRNA hydrolase
MLLFVGLGNPTPDSENNRHNVGFKIIDSINKKFGLSKQKPNLKDCSQLEMLVIKKSMQSNL